MQYFRFTLFNGITLFIIGLTVVTAWRRFAARPDSKWPVAYYGAITVYTFAFPRALSRWWVVAGVWCVLLIRFGVYPKYVRWAEAVVLAYVLWRCVGLILMW